MSTLARASRHVVTAVIAAVAVIARGHRRARDPLEPRADLPGRRRAPAPHRAARLFAGRARDPPRRPGLLGPRVAFGLARLGDLRGAAARAGDAVLLRAARPEQLPRGRVSRAD